MDKRLHGLIPAIVIPFDEKMEIEHDVLEKYLQQYIVPAKIAAIAVNTDAGEGAFLSQEKREEILAITKKYSTNVPVVCGLGAQTTQQALEYGKRYKDLGADYFLVFPHFAFKGSRGKDKAVIEYHIALSKIGFVGHPFVTLKSTLA